MGNSQEVHKERPGKEFYIAGSDIKELIEWDEADGCLAADRILVDGCKVGYMYREEPDENWPDSGWRFFAGDEDDDYTNNPDNSGIYKLNTLANYDTEIIPFLSSPYGSAFGRDEKGVFRSEQR